MCLQQYEMTKVVNKLGKLQLTQEKITIETDANLTVFTFSYEPEIKTIVVTLMFFGFSFLSCKMFEDMLKNTLFSTTMYLYRKQRSIHPTPAQKVGGFFFENKKKTKIETDVNAKRICESRKPHSKNAWKTKFIEILAGIMKILVAIWVYSTNRNEIGETVVGNIEDALYNTQEKKHAIKFNNIFVRRQTKLLKKHFFIFSS